MEKRKRPNSRKRRSGAKKQRKVWRRAAANARDRATPPAAAARPAIGATDDRTSEETPHWDHGHNWTVRLGSVNRGLIKKIATQATTQRPLLDAAEAAHWPHPVASPYADMPWPERGAFLSRELNLMNKDQCERHVLLTPRDKARAFDWAIIK
jgi:hypothetical protein